MSSFADRFTVPDESLIRRRHHEASANGLTSATGTPAELVEASLIAIGKNARRLTECASDVTRLLTAVEEARRLLAEADAEVLRVRKMYESEMKVRQDIRSALVDALGGPPSQTGAIMTARIIAQLKTQRTRLAKLVDLAEKAQQTGDRIGATEVLWVAKYGDAHGPSAADAAADPVAART